MKDRQIKHEHASSATSASRASALKGTGGFLADLGLGFAGLAMGSLLAQDGVVRADADLTAEAHASRSPAARAKSVIWIFLSGGVSHLETFDPKPVLNKYRRQDVRRDDAAESAEVAAVSGALAVGRGR